MQEAASTQYHSRDQHKELSETRHVRDSMDTQAIVQFLVNRNPFTLQFLHFHNIATGVVSGNHANADCAKEVGEEIVSSMEDKQVLEYIFKWKAQAVLINIKNSITVNEERISVDP